MPADLGDVRILVLMGASHLFGQERANIQVMRVLKKKGAKVHFITSSLSGERHVQPFLTALGFDWTTAPFGFHWSRKMLGRDWINFPRNFYGILATSLHAVRQAKRWKATHIYTMNSSYFFFALPGIRWLRLPLIYRAGDLLPRHSAFHRWVAGRLFALADKMVCNSKYVAQRMREHGMLDERMQVIYNYPPAHFCKPGEVLDEPPTGALKAIFIGQISEHKGVALLLKAISRLIEQNVNVALRIVGESAWENPLFEKLKAFSAEKGIGRRVVFLGAVEDVSAVMRGSDLLVCPSIWDDPSPNVIVEAKREGLPSLAFSVGGIPELIHHRVDGYLCSEITQESLIEGLLYFDEDRSRLVAAGVAARVDFEKRFSYQQFSCQWRSVFCRDEAPRLGC